MTKTWDDVEKEYIEKFTCAGGTKDCRLSHDRCFSDNANYETVEKYFTTAFYQIMSELERKINEIEGSKMYPISNHANEYIQRNKVLSLLPKDYDANN